MRRKWKWGCGRRRKVRKKKKKVVKYEVKEDTQVLREPEIEFE